jgi:hypothetical protein
MTTGTFAFELQSSLNKALGIHFKRSHVHEVVAALLGFSSYAAMTTQRVLAQHDGSAPAASFDIEGAARRVLRLGYAPPMAPIVAARTARAVEAARLCVITIDDVLFELGVGVDGGALAGSERDPLAREDSDVTGQWGPRSDDLAFRIDRDSVVLRESLLRMADAGSARAHLALACFDDEFVSEQPEGAMDGRYWFELQQAGRLLTGVELEWAQAYRRKREALRSKNEHLQRAVERGNVEAALRLLEEEPCVEHFELASRLAGDGHAARLGHLAVFFDRRDDALKWFRIAARQGDIGAMKVLASSLESEPKAAWTWVYLAELLGARLMEYHAVGDDGLPADADEAGPIYAAGGFDLDPLSARDRAEAVEAARSIHVELSGPA